MGVRDKRHAAFNQYLLKVFMAQELRHAKYLFRPVMSL